MRPKIYAAFESCREKMDKQLRRYKRRIRNHHNHRTAPVEFGESVLVYPRRDPRMQRMWSPIRFSPS